MISEVTNEDNMAMMSRYPDKFFDLAIVDPEYGIGAGKMTMGKGKKKKFKQDKEWDSKPPEQSYFDELFRVSKNQIIWGGNYFIDKLLPTKHFLIWDKLNDGRDGCELDKEYFDASCKRFNTHIAQQKLFAPNNTHAEQITLL